MNNPETIKKKSEPIKHESISFRLNVEDKEYVHDVINRIKEIDIIMTNKLAFICMISLFDDLILHNEDIKQMFKQRIDEYKLNENLNAIRKVYHPLDASDVTCMYLIKPFGTFMCSKDPIFGNNQIKFKPLKDFPVDCESCIDKR